MSLNLLIALLLLVVVLGGLFTYRFSTTNQGVASIIAAVSAVLLFLMAVGTLHF